MFVEQHRQSDSVWHLCVIGSGPAGMAIYPVGDVGALADVLRPVVETPGRGCAGDGVRWAFERMQTRGFEQDIQRLRQALALVAPWYVE